MLAPIDIEVLTLDNGLHISPARKHRRRDGTVKVAYSDPHAAMAAISQIVDGERTARLTAYQCPTCGDWHIGNHHPDASVRVEVGERAWSNMRAENRPGVEHGTIYARAYVTVVSRAETALRRG